MVAQCHSRSPKGVRWQISETCKSTVVEALRLKLEGNACCNAVCNAVSEKLTNLIACQTSRKFSATSYYPGRGDTTHPLSFLDPTNDGRRIPNVDDNGFESDEDWNVDEQTVELSLQNPSRFAEVMANEVSLQHPRPSVPSI